jgi:nucleoid-associated protein YgaU
MGKVEKVIVLSVLFLVTLILVVTVTVDDPLDKTNVVEAGAKKAPAVAQGPTNPAANPNPLLSTSVDPRAPAGGATPATAPSNAGATIPVAANTPAPASAATAVPESAPAKMAQPATAVAATPGPALPPGALLRTTEGLQDSWFPDLKLYTWKKGDTWRSLANTYYGDWKRLDVLKRSNEGRMDVAPGETVFVPVFADERARAAAAEPVAVEAGAPQDGSGTSTSAKTAPGSKAGKGTGAKIHVVTNGESLWTIAKKELGDGNRWKEIYEANRDILKKPESIQKGMRLRIP